MKIPRMTVITLGVADLARATAFYREIFSVTPITQYEGVTFIPLPGVWLSLYPLEKLAEGIAEDVTLPAPNTFRGFTLAYNAHSKEEINSIFARAADVGAHIAKIPQDTFWGGWLLHRPGRTLLGSGLGADVRIHRAWRSAIQDVSPLPNLSHRGRRAGLPSHIGGGIGGKRKPPTELSTL